MIGIKKRMVEETISAFQTRIHNYNAEAFNRLEEVRESYKAEFNNSENAWLNRLIEFHKKQNLMTLDLVQQEKLNKKLKKFPEKLTSLSKSGKVNLKTKILWALDYKSIRRDFLPEFFQKIGIKACVYCNSQLTITVDKSIKPPKGKFQADHYYPKSKYPHLSISLYNLYPTCASCNHSKLDEKIDFQLYQDSVKESPFAFTIDKNSLSSYLTSKNHQELRILFIDPEAPAKTSFEKKFHISGIYETQKDLAEEIILRAHIYNEAYKDTLQNSFPELLPDSQILERLLIGNYVEPNDIHKRPMAKFVQDITMDVKLHLAKEQ